MKRFTASGCIVAAIILCLSGNASAAERVVILAPAAADVLTRLNAGDSVVGVTSSVSDFPRAANVGTHMNPGLETIASLKPTLIIAGTKFNPEFAERMGAECFIYHPGTLGEIIASIRILAQKIGKEAEGIRLARELQAALDRLTPPRHSPTVLYETRSIPLSLAKGDAIIRDVLERAGMRYAFAGNAGMVSVEYLMSNQPEIYIYQHGPMSRNPVPPARRPGWDRFGACAWKVSEFDFARPNARLFETVQTLNAILNEDDSCAAGIRRYPE